MAEESEESNEQNTSAGIDNPEGLTKEELDARLRELPFQVFLMVAGADGTVDEIESDRFFKLIEERKICRSPYSRWLFSETRKRSGQLVKAYQEGKLTADLNRIHETLRYVNMHIPQKNALAFNEDLERMAMGIAQASSGFFAAKSVSKKERAALLSFHEIVKTELQEAQKMLLAEIKEEESKK
ncbi:MAG: hypothetical protein ACO4AU_03765 [bacterium]|jgi:hypothetical protein